MESEIRDEILRRQNLPGSRTGVVAVIKPCLNAGAIVRNAGAEADRRLHHVQRDRALKIARNVDEEVVPHHIRYNRNTEKRGMSDMDYEGMGGGRRREGA